MDKLVRLISGAASRLNFSQFSNGSTITMRELKKILSENCSDFWCSRLRTIDTPTTVEFLRDCVSAYHPVIIKGLAEDWPARHKWDLEYLEAKCSDSFPVNITPDGRADSVQVVEGVPTFCYPAETHMTMSTFRSMMESRQPDDAVPYLSEQDNNFSRIFPELRGDVPVSLILADEAFGCLPEATNIWIGDERSVSSMHKDHFENMYVVLRGQKTFTLLPPSDVAFLPARSFPTVRHTLSADATAAGSSHRVRMCDLSHSRENCVAERLEWIAVDVDAPGAEQQHGELFAHIQPLRCTVQAGETLYIPAMWYHQVSQTELTISINYWYDMKFDFRYVFHQLAAALKTNEGDDDDTSKSDFTES